MIQKVNFSSRFTDGYINVYVKLILKQKKTLDLNNLVFFALSIVLIIASRNTSLCVIPKDLQASLNSSTNSFLYLAFTKAIFFCRYFSCGRSFHSCLPLLKYKDKLKLSIY